MLFSERAGLSSRAAAVLNGGVATGAGTEGSWAGARGAAATAESHVLAARDALSSSVAAARGATVAGVASGVAGWEGRTLGAGPSMFSGTLHAVPAQHAKVQNADSLNALLCSVPRA